MSLKPFPTTTNPKKEHPQWDMEFVALATRMGLKGFVLTQKEFEASVGQKKGDAFVPRRQPRVPPQGASPSEFKLYDINDRLFLKEDNGRIELIGTLLAALDTKHLKVVGDIKTGTNNKTLLEMRTALIEKYGIWQEGEINALKASCSNGEVSLNEAEPIDVYLQAVNEIFTIAASNHSAFPEADKIMIVAKELKKLGSEDINMFLLAYKKAKNQTLASKNFEKFAVEAKIAYKTADKATMKAA